MSLVATNLCGLAISLVYRSGEEGGLLLAQIVSTCIQGSYRRGRGETAPCAWVWRSKVFNMRLPACLTDIGARFNSRPVALEVNSALSHSREN